MVDGSFRWIVGFLLPALGAASVIGGPAAAQETAFEPLPSPPPFDGTPIEGGEARDAAVKAIGPLAATFTDRSVDSPSFIGPQDVWVGKFFTKPEVVKPGLCVERMLIVPLRLARLAGGRVTWQAHNVRWVDQTRAVGPFDEAERAAPDPKEDAACQDLGFFKTMYGSNVIQADSAADAWRAGLVLRNLARAAQGRARLGFSLRCEPAGDGLCKSPRRSLAKLKPAALASVWPCDMQNAAKDCIRISVRTPYGYGDAYWILTVKLEGESTRATDVTMAFDVPPVI